MGLLSRAHGRLQQILYGDLVPQSLIEQLLPRRQLAVGQDLDLLKGRRQQVWVKDSFLRGPCCFRQKIGHFFK